MKPDVKPVPDGYHTAIPYLIVRGAAEAIEFYKKAFGATEQFRMPDPSGRIMHAEIRIGDSVVMLSEENIGWGAKSPLTLNGTGASVFLYLPDVDTAFQQAVAAGGKAQMPPADMFWGDRFGKLVDPFGHEWSMATHIEDVPQEQMAERAASAFAEQSKG
ncbi:MAG: VOC family protein [Thermoanaerobaculia bacterium]